ncbi:hypothetical protein GOP47_0028249 [Adiantum capillus-veneris]|nr:hypothetical protein GOP47_0028249 [Adiantum capillus-veneris]
MASLLMVAAMLLLVAALLLLHKAFSVYIWRPLPLQKFFKTQGIRGPPYRIPFGNYGEFSALNKAALASPMPHITHDMTSHLSIGWVLRLGWCLLILSSARKCFSISLVTIQSLPWFLPTATNRSRWRLRKQTSSILEQIIRRRLSLANENESDAFGSDLLGLMLSALKEESRGNQKNLVTMSLQEIIDECKTFFFAGHETTSSLLTWAWSSRCEFLELKLIGMILHEVLRLYPPAVDLSREANKDVKLGGISIPGGTSMFFPILVLHVDPKLWGEDALQFNPLRFEGGISKACKHSSAFLPFGVGPRICVGQNFSLMEAKIARCMILQKFQFRISPAYRHAPRVVLTLQPEHGMPTLLDPLVA